MAEIDDDLRGSVNRAVVEAVQAGQSWQTVRDGLADLFPRGRAERIARTEVIRAGAQGALAGYEESGTVRGVRWLDGQPGACPLCQELHNQVRPLGQPFYSDKFGDGLPPRHPHCRCAVAPITLDEVRRLPQNHPLRQDYRQGVQDITDIDA